jgi:radical SAM superfamily enzyme YgiQ (UPF0313 family)
MRDKIKRILLIRMNSPTINAIKHPLHCYPPLALKYMKRLLEIKESYQIRLLDCWVKRKSSAELFDYTINWAPDLIIISIDTVTFKSSLAFASLIKKHKKEKVLIVGFGQDVTSRPKEYLFSDSPFDIVLLGEAEEEVVFLVERLNNDTIRDIKEYNQLQIQRGPIVINCLDRLPALNWTPKELQDYRFIYPLRINKKTLCGYVISSRGCPHNCIFCSPIMRKSYGRKVRLRSASKVVDEIEYLMEMGVNLISFEDADFTISKEHVVSICKEIEKRDLRINWLANIRIDEVTLPLLKTMKRAGCILLLFGIESGSKRIIEILQKKRSDIDWNKKAKEVLRQTKKVGIATCAFFIIGSPTETEREVEETIRLAKILSPDMIKVHFFTPYPGSPVYEQFKERINQEDLLRMHHYATPLVNLSNMDIVKLRQLQSNFYRDFFLNPEFIFTHLVKYAGFYFHNKDIFYTLFKGVVSCLKLPSSINQERDRERNPILKEYDFR